jgi:penicillin-binding protein 1C
MIEETENYHQIAVKPKAVKQSITLVDETGNKLVQIFSVLDKEK